MIQTSSGSWWVFRRTIFKVQNICNREWKSTFLINFMLSLIVHHFRLVFCKTAEKYIIRVNRCAGAHKIRVWVSESPISWAQLSYSMGFVTHNYRATGVDCLCSHCNRSVLCVEWRASDGNIQLNNNLCRLR